MCLGGCETIDDQWQGHVIEDRAIQQQTVILKDHADLTTNVGNIAAGDATDIVAVKTDPTVARTLHHPNQLEQGTFPSPGVAGKKSHLALLQVEANLLQGLVASGVMFADLFKTNHG